LDLLSLRSLSPCEPLYPPPSSFFLYASRHHGDLRSFPTRRSSDLGGDSRRLDRQDAAWAALARDGRGARSHAHRQPARLAGQVEDRKSTRLNSSHRTISYAVFCLKKKKQYENG